MRVCAAFEAPIFQSSSSALAHFVAVGVNTDGTTSYAWADDDTVRLRTQSSTGVFSPQLSDSDAGAIVALKLVSAGLRSLLVWGTAEGVTRVSRFAVDAGWAEPEDLPVVQSGAPMQLGAALEENGNASVWRVGTLPGATLQTLQEYTSAAAAPFGPQTELSDAGTILHLAIGAGPSRLVLFSDAMDLHAIVRLGAMESRLALNPIATDFVGAVASDGSVATFAAVVPFDAGTDAITAAVFTPSAPGSFVLSTADAGLSFVKGALAAGGRAAIIWQEDRHAYASFFSLDGGFSAPQALPTDGYGVFSQLTETSGVFYFLGPGFVPTTIEVGVDGYIGTPAPQSPALYSSSRIALSGSSGGAAFIGAGGLADGGFGVTTSQCR